MSPSNTQLDLFSDLSAFEGTDVEYKGARGGLPADLWETYSAFANTEGGTIYLGITQRANKLDVHGVENAEKLISDFWNTINNRSKVNSNLLTNRDVGQLAVEGSTCKVIAIHVPRANRKQRPIYLGADPFVGTYRRNFEGDYRCSDSEVRRMFADQSEEPVDSRIMQGFSFDDLDIESLRQYRNRFQSRAPSHPWLAKDEKALLEQMGGWRRDRKENLEGITLAGLLMFGKTSAIQTAEAVPGFQVDYRERLSDDPRVRWSDRLTIDGTWEANLFQFYQRVMAKFASDPGLKRPFAQDAEGVRPFGTPVHEALQEALVNALIHADYNGQGGVIIDRFADRFVFSNPGTLLVSYEQVWRGGVSECRNKALQVMFQMLGVGDKAGSGFDKIRDSWKSLHWQSPRLEETQRPDRVVLALPLVSMLPDEVLVDLQRRFGEERFRSLGKDEVQILATAQMEGSVSNHRLQEILTLHRRDITTLLQTLVRERLLAPDGFGRWTRYTLADDHREPDVRPDSPDLAATPPNLAMSSPDLASDSPDLESKTAGSGKFPPGMDMALLAIADPIRRSGKAPSEVVRAVILELCQGRFLRLRELSDLLDRKQESLRDNYISNLVAEGLLDLRFPGARNHPDQAYRTTQDALKDASA